MFSRNALILSALLTASALATSIHPLLAARQVSNCQSKCGPIVNQIQSNNCPLSCICTTATINALGACLNCAEANGASIPGVGPNYVPNLVSSCDKAGYPVSGVNSGGSSGGGSSDGGDSGDTSSGLSGTGLPGGGGLSGTDAIPTATGGLGGGGGSLTTGGSVSQTTTPGSSGGNNGGNNGGLTLKKNGATSSTVQLGVVAAAVAGVLVLAA